MNKILIEVTSPAAGQTYDMFVPDSLQIGELTMLVSSVFAQTSNGTYSLADNAIVSDKKTGFILDVNKTVKESNIRNGTKLLLF